MIRPPFPWASSAWATARLRKKPAFRLMSCWSVPVFLRHLVHMAAPDEDGGGIGQHVEPPEARLHLGDQRLVPGDIAEIDAQGQMRAAFHVGDDLGHALLVDVHGGDAAAGLGEGQRHLAADAARRPGDDDALALEARADVPAHDVSSLLWLSVRRAGRSSYAPRRSTIAPRPGISGGPPSAG